MINTELTRPCRECTFYRPNRNPETNRPRPTLMGSCAFEVKWPVLPKSFAQLDGWTREWEISLPKSQSIWPDDKRECLCFKAREYEPIDMT